MTTAHGVAVQPDGKLVAVGVAKTSRSGDFALARYNTNGSLDATFGTGGKVTTDFNGNDDAANAVVLQPDGKIVVAGEAKTSRNQDFARNDDAAFALVLQPDGKLVAAGEAKTSRNQDFALARYNANGSLDPTFGTGGKVKSA